MSSQKNSDDSRMTDDDQQHEGATTPSTPSGSRKSIDPQKLTVRELKSILKDYVELPPEQQKKAYYVDLYNKYVVNANSEATTPSSSSDKKRKSDAVENVASDNENEEESEEPEQKKVKPTPQSPQNEFQQASQSKSPAATSSEVTSNVEVNVRKAKSLTSSDLPQQKPSNEETPIMNAANRRKTVGTAASSTGRSTQQMIYRKKTTSEINPKLFQTTPMSSRISVSSPFVHDNAEGVDPRPSEVESSSSGRQILLSTFMLLVWAVLFFCVYLFFFGQRDPHLPYGGVYCNSEDGLLRLKPEEGCLPCPDFGYCLGGRLIKCDEGYIMKNAVCVKDERIPLASIQFINDLQAELSSLAGKYECGEAKQKTKLLDDVKKSLATKPYAVGLDENLVMAQVAQLIKSSPENFQLVISEEPVDNTDEKASIIFSTNSSLPFQCRVTKTVLENKGVIGTIVILAIFVIIGNVIKKRIDKERVDFEDLVRIALTRIKERSEIVVEHLRDELKEDYGDQINVDKLWPKVEDFLSQDTRIRETPVQQGRAYSWNVVENQSTPRATTPSE
ncbi:hypothetical protein FDP41_004222 [Naegleria fowleri]|uniref:Man1/Src1-like C-terminal domain-containing protein n=1 Tax=Naegleria fowleri TaxID=5763 RepID=A0A6A5BIX6_NAEFO|nr:uncharacterized protein FDP41_004222 [Naegleria fowleri]KAF0976927.1 hypothetical protein FDP41_004222 [Naegleria fowleri]CAG4711101.1 unnamed protein product [Naegleria fowleri]